MRGFVSYIANRDVKTGVAEYTVSDGKNSVRCTGVIPAYPKFSPVEVTGMENRADGRTYLANAEISLYCDNPDFVKKFAGSGRFTGIAAKKAAEIADMTDGKLYDFTLSSEKTEPELFNNPTLGPFFKMVRRMTSFDSCMKKFKGILSYHQISKLFDKYGEASENVVHENPYVLLYCGVSYGECEKMAHDNGMEMCSPKRLVAITAAAMERNREKGNTKLLFTRLCDSINYMEKSAGGFYKTPPFFISWAVLDSDRYAVEDTDKDCEIYTVRDRKNEEIIADRVKALNMREEKKEIPAEYSVYTEGLAPEQLEAVKMCLTPGVRIITGGPGTGKTTVINAITKIYAMEHPGMGVALCAPTGAAAARMSEATGLDASTIHRLLQIRAYEDDGPACAKPVDAGLVIVDECSMLDTELAAILLTAVKPGCALVLVGDAEQLPSVGAGNVFADLIASGSIPVVKLTKIFRQKGAEELIDDSMHIINGVTGLSTGHEVYIRRYPDAETLAKAAVAAAAGMEKKFDGDRYRVYTPVRDRKFIAGTAMLNRGIQDTIHGAGGAYVRYGGTMFHAKDRVIFIKNNYKKGYYNGQNGVVTSIQNHGEYALISVLSEGTIYNLTGNDIGDIEPAYALTAHKAQGSECDYALIVTPKEPANMLQRRLIYVELTRAKKGALILSEGDALEQAIRSQRDIRRNTGLLTRLTRDRKTA